MKTRSLICLTFSTLAFWACTSEDPTVCLSTQTTQINSIPVIYTIDTVSSTADLAKKIALEFPRQEKTRSKVDKEIKEILTINGDEGNPVMYVVNYQNDAGFIITSATQDYTPVLAYSDNG